ncbi:hypothetical protein CKM354_001253200 [Cercospora kikuchii]|uniref:F-box domain-containing protein n=1 Tax=Cercospora kikuchii TaxID=84275 RepID=A0A9P3FM68_9PEZI|nr:uncharacterized protein CKM354_001253200 [Cercospora kikuchii]GIZ49502.1 hypothetical protein CKM354_001253200 [Cercospora kikuchii]
MSATDLQSQGRQAYKRGDHAKALGYFNRALGRQQTVQLYDNRAATYEKLNDFKKALQDAKATIRISDVDPTGYLRAGRILTKMEKSKAALDIYAYGLKHVKHVGLGYEQLKKLHDDLLGKLAPTNSVDPLTVLPRELAISVLEYCTFRERIAICRVSKGWQKFVRSEPNLWTHLDLGAARVKVKTSFVSTAINSGKQKIRSATLNKLFDFDKVLAALLRHCPLESLTLVQTGLQGNNLVEVIKNAKAKLKLRELKILKGTELSQTTLREAATACSSTLEVLHCAHMKTLSFAQGWSDAAFPSLVTLSLTADQIFNLNLYLKQFLERSPHLVSLTLTNLDHYDHEVGDSPVTLDLRTLKLETVDLQMRIRSIHFAKLPATVKTLRLVSVGHFLPYLTDYIARPDVDGYENGFLSLWNLHALEHVYLRLPSTPLENFLEAFESRSLDNDTNTGSATSSRLRSLALEQTSVQLTKTLVIPPRLRELESLSLRDSMGLTDEIILAIVKGLPKLRSLDVSGSLITGAGVGDLLRMEQFTEMVLNNCQKIGHRDAIDQARKKGVKVEYKMDDWSSGKKVRF